MYIFPVPEFGSGFVLLLISEQATEMMKTRIRQYIFKKCYPRSKILIIWCSITRTPLMYIAKLFRNQLETMML